MVFIIFEVSSLALVISTMETVSLSMDWFALARIWLVVAMS